MILEAMPKRLAPLSLAKIRKYEPLARARGVSEVARSRGGFLPAYRRAGGRLSDMGRARDGTRWATKRAAFLRRHLAQMIANQEPLFEESGRPTRRHLALIMWGFSPVARRL